jgi:exodeoxyribonuclease VIII
VRVAIESLLGGSRNEVAGSIDWSDYKDLAGLNPSTIVKAVRGRDDDGELILSMARLKHAWDHYDREDSDDLLWGRAVHCLLFEPQEFEHRYVACTMRRDKRTAAYQDFLLDNQGKEVLTATQWDTALAAARSFVSDEKVQEIISEPGQNEVTVFKSVHGVQCRGRLDRIVPSLKLIPDLKTTKCLEPRKFGYDFFGYHYDIKLGLYRDWLSSLTSCQFGVTVIALEKEPPYEVAVIPVPDAVLDYGAEKGRKIIRRVRECIESGVWPGTYDGEGYLYVPSREMEDVELIGATEVIAA